MNEITIIGFGNQARAWALNLRDSNLKVFIGLRKSSISLSVAKDLGFSTFCFEEEKIPTSNFALLIPDSSHQSALETISKLNSNINCVDAHGYSLSKFNLQSLYPNLNHILLAPKSIASELRFLYETKGNLTGFYSLEFAPNVELAEIKMIAQNLGMKNLYPTSFLEETQADLFSEQTILCSLLPYGILESFNTLVNKGYSKELAFYECFYEAKLILDTIFKVGPKDFFNLISPNALIGSQIGKDLLIDDAFKEKLRVLLQNIENDTFQDQIKSTDIDQLRNNISSFWKDQTLSKTYDEHKDSL
jgi:ketol-acid reductoisomerase